MEAMIECLTDDFNAYRHVVCAMLEDSDTLKQVSTIDKNEGSIQKTLTINDQENSQCNNTLEEMAKSSGHNISSRVLLVKLPSDNYKAPFFKLTDKTFKARIGTSSTFQTFKFDLVSKSIYELASAVSRSRSSCIAIAGPRNTFKRSLAIEIIRQRLSCLPTSNPRSTYTTTIKSGENPTTNKAFTTIRPDRDITLHIVSSIYRPSDSRSSTLLISIRTHDVKCSNIVTVAISTRMMQSMCMLPACDTVVAVSTVESVLSRQSSTMACLKDSDY
jgi:hypothetical protein